MRDTAAYLCGKGPSLDAFDWASAPHPGDAPRFAINEACLVVPHSVGVAQDSDVWLRIGEAPVPAWGSPLVVVPAAGMTNASKLMPHALVLPTSHGWPLHKRFTAEVALRVIRAMNGAGAITVRLVGFDLYFAPDGARAYAESVKAQSLPWNIEKSGISQSPIERINDGISLAAKECVLTLVDATAR